MVRLMKYSGSISRGRNSYIYRNIVVWPEITLNNTFFLITKKEWNEALKRESVQVWVWLWIAVYLYFCLIKHAQSENKNTVAVYSYLELDLDFFLCL